MDNSQEEENGREETSAVPAPEAPSAIVGIGASAGGLEALEQFFTHMPADTGMAFVLVTHMDPNQKGMPVNHFSKLPPASSQATR
ncbi:MAG: hypothetical protein CVV31_01745 [Methanomicrobiales archaeon HGW-Methanomicrobiales-2]|jgi:chemotaxis response regulator CheB|nr:MAG: hypothetical protein CVV31_01745 [Methanomicrobiales archaeon HGW-Methanomicrobiales-2]